MWISKKEYGCLIEKSINKQTSRIDAQLEGLTTINYKEKYDKLCDKLIRCGLAEITEKEKNKHIQEVDDIENTFSNKVNEYVKDTQKNPIEKEEILIERENYYEHKVIVKF